MKLVRIATIQFYKYDTLATYGAEARIQNVQKWEKHTQFRARWQCLYFYQVSEMFMLFCFDR